MPFPCFALASEFEQLENTPFYAPASKFTLVSEEFDGAPHAVIFEDVEDCRTRARGMTPTPEPIRLADEWVLWKALQKSSLTRFAEFPAKTSTRSRVQPRLRRIEDLSQTPPLDQAMRQAIQDHLSI